MNQNLDIKLIVKSLLKCILKSPFECIFASKKHVLIVDVNTNVIATNTTLINKKSDINR